MSKELSENNIIKMLDWSYDKAINGLPGFDSAVDMAEDYLKTDESLTEQVNTLIRWQNAKAGTSGFLAGLGGILTLPVAIPANISSVMFMQIRMIASIAHMGGYDIKDDRIRSLIYVCLTGHVASEILKDIGIIVGTKLTSNAIKNISGKTFAAINQKVGFRLLTKFGEKGAINLGKAVPLVGGVIGASFDSLATNTVGNIARDTFISETDIVKRAPRLES